MWWDSASISQVCEFSTGLTSSPFTAAPGEWQHSIICALCPGQLLKDGALFFLFRYLVQALVGDPGQSLLLL